MERDRSAEPAFTLRTHHICIFEEIAPKFFEFSGGIPPWEYSVKDFWQIKAFTQGFAEQEIGKDRMMRTYFENFVIESPTAEEDYLYIIDLIGNDEDSYQKVLAGRTLFFTNVFKVVCGGRNTKVFLADAPDGYCNSCAIGKHCLEKGPDEFNNDIRIRNKLIELMRESPSPDFFRPEMIGYDEQGRLFVTAELLFNPQLYKYLDSKK